MMFKNIENIKYTKPHSYKKKHLTFRITRLHQGHYGILVLNSMFLQVGILETLRRFLVRLLLRKGVIWFRNLSFYGMTAKAVGTRMGGGKGAIKNWGVYVPGGSVFIEFTGPKLLNTKNQLKPLFSLIKGNCILIKRPSLK